MSVARKGKIAALPFKIRSEVNQRLRDGQTARQINPWLNGLKSVTKIMSDRFEGEPISAQNLSEWRQGGYQDWLQEQKKIDKLRHLSEFALGLAESAGGDITAGSAAIAGGRILEALENAAEDDLTKLIDDLASLRSLELTSQKIELDREKVRQKDEQIALEKKKFQRTTAELFIKFFEEEEARQIVQGRGSKAQKVDQLVQTMFGENPLKKEEG